jgi:alanine racemase
MDAVMADVTDVPGPPVTPDDEFVLLGEQGDARITAAELARERTSISWEVVAAMSARLPRVYTAPAEAVGICTLTKDRGPWRRSRSGMGTSVTSRWTRS